MVNNLLNLNARMLDIEAVGAGGLIQPTNVPIGGIILWMRSQGEIPAGWALCDGTNGTHDMRDKFVYGAAEDEDIGETGGAETHIHTNPKSGTSGGHNHSGSGSTSGPSANVPVGSGSGINAASSGHTHSYSFSTGNAGEHSHSVGSTGLASNLPPFVRSYYIQRIA
jgi:hypothetical protein